MTDTITTVGTWGLGLALVGVGFWLMIWGIMDIGSGIGGKTKEWGKAGMGLFIGVVGGFLVAIGAVTIINWFKKGGSEIPLK